MPNPTLERLERLSHAEKITHWGGEKPWAGFRLPPVKRPFGPNKVKIDDGGQILDIPPHLGRPCLGQPTAFMRHGGGKLQFNPRTRTWEPDRCGRCQVKKACEFIAKKRLRATPEIDALYQEWERLGGREASWNADGARGTIQIVLRDLLAALRAQAATFQSVNDAHILAHYNGLAAARRAEDAKRQRRNRLKQRIESARTGEFDPAVLKVLENHRIWRQVEHTKALSHPDGPPRLKKAKSPSSLFDSRVWVAKTRMELRGTQANDSNVAREMQALGYETHRTHGALRDAVRRSLDRIVMLEQTKLPGRNDPIWPRFGERELRDDLSFNPLQAFDDQNLS